MGGRGERFLSVSTDDKGMCAVEGLLDPEVGEMLMRALDAASEALDRERGPIPAGADAAAGEAARRRADAIALMAQRAIATRRQRRRG